MGGVGGVEGVGVAGGGGGEVCGWWLIPGGVVYQVYGGDRIDGKIDVRVSARVLARTSGTCLSTYFITTGVRGRCFIKMLLFQMLEINPLWSELYSPGPASWMARFK